MIAICFVLAKFIVDHGLSMDEQITFNIPEWNELKKN